MRMHSFGWLPVFVAALTVTAGSAALLRAADPRAPTPETPVISRSTEQGKHLESDAAGLRVGPSEKYPLREHSSLVSSPIFSFMKMRMPDLDHARPMTAGATITVNWLAGLHIALDAGTSSCPKNCPGGCNDGNPCTLDKCVSSPGYYGCYGPYCVHTPANDGSKCDDGIACTTSDTCSNGTCVGTPNCNDANACTLDSCDLATGSCAHSPVVCNDFNQCTQDSCVPATGCMFDPTPGASCNDGNACTQGDTCVLSSVAGLVCAGTPLVCDDGNACTADLCVSSTGSCFHSPISCDDGNVCTLDSCDSTLGCTHTPAPGTLCSDGNPCTQGDTCVLTTSGAVACVGSSVTCNDGSVCTHDSCNQFTGYCVFESLSCDDFNPCTIDTCDPVYGCQHLGEPGEVGPIAFTSPTSLEWSATPDTSTYNTYRGLIPTLGGMGSLPQPYSHVCFESGDAQLNGATLTVDDEALPEGTVLYYLVDGELTCGEGTLGEASDGTARPNPFPCPTPPP